MGLRMRTATLGIFGGIALSAAIAAPASASAQGPAAEHASRAHARTPAVSAVRLEAGHSGNLVEVTGHGTTGQRMSRECAAMMARHPQESHKCACQCGHTMPADQAHRCTCCTDKAQQAA